MAGSRSTSIVILVVAVVLIISSAIGIMALRWHDESMQPAAGRTASPTTAQSAIAEPELSTGDGPPPLELQRAKEEPQAHDPNAKPITIDSDIECGTPITVRQITPTHFEVKVLEPGQDHWFMYRLRGAAGRTVRIDLTNASPNMNECPVYANAAALDDLALYASPPTPADDLTQAWNTTMLPSTKGQQWHYIDKNWAGEGNAFCSVLQVQSDSVYIGQRIPYPATYGAAFLKSVQANPAAQVFDLDTTPGGRHITLVKIGAGDEAEKKNPCVVMYASEHPTEPDAMWMAQGAIEFLISDQPDAKKLREQLTFIIVPLFDPDRTADIYGLRGPHGTHLAEGFSEEFQTHQTVAYAKWFEAWVTAGKRLDLVYDLGSFDYDPPQVTCIMAEGQGERGRLAEALHGLMAETLRGQYSVEPGIPHRGINPPRLGGWLDISFGPMCLAYWIDAQDQQRHMNLHEVKNLGAVFAQTTARFFTTDDGIAELANVDARRKIRLLQIAKLDRANPPQSPITREINIADIQVPGMSTDPPEKTYP